VRLVLKTDEDIRDSPLVRHLPIYISNVRRQHQEALSVTVAREDDDPDKV